MKSFKLSLCIALVLGFCVNVSAQNIIIQQNNSQGTQQTERVIEKKVYVPVEKQSAGPVVLFGYLYVYPEDLGKFRVQDFPSEVIKNINKAKAFGRGTWRLPTDAELRMMSEANGGEYNVRGKLHLNAGFGCKYMCKDDYGNPIRWDGNDYYSPDSFQMIRLVSSE